MSLFPFINLEESEYETQDTSLPLYKELAWDYKNNQPKLVNGNFVVVTGNEAIKVWVHKTILTERYEYPIYSWDYGCEITALIGTSYTVNFVKMETKRYIKEALLTNPYILEVDVTDVDFKGCVLTANIDIKTIYGEVNVNV